MNRLLRPVWVSGAPLGRLPPRRPGPAAPPAAMTALLRVLFDHLVPGVAYHAEQAREAKDVVAVQVSDEDFGQVGDFQVALQSARARKKRERERG